MNSENNFLSFLKIPICLIILKKKPPKHLSFLIIMLFMSSENNLYLFLNIDVDKVLYGWYMVL